MPGWLVSAELACAKFKLACLLLPNPSPIRLVFPLTRWASNTKFPPSPPSRNTPDPALAAAMASASSAAKAVTATPAFGGKAGKAGTAAPTFKQAAAAVVQQHAAPDADMDPGPATTAAAVDGEPGVEADGAASATSLQRPPASPATSGSTGASQGSAGKLAAASVWVLEGLRDQALPMQLGWAAVWPAPHWLCKLPTRSAVMLGQSHPSATTPAPNHLISPSLLLG